MGFLPDFFAVNIAHRFSLSTSSGVPFSHGLWCRTIISESVGCAALDLAHRYFIVRGDDRIIEQIMKHRRVVSEVVDHETRFLDRQSRWFECTEPRAAMKDRMRVRASV